MTDEDELDFLGSRLLAQPATKADIVAAVQALRGDINGLKRSLTGAIWYAVFAGIALGGLMVMLDLALCQP